MSTTASKTVAQLQRATQLKAERHAKRLARMSPGLAAFWAQSASESVVQAYEAGDVVTIDLTAKG